MNLRINLHQSLLAMLLALSLAAPMARAQSADIDNPTPLQTNVIDGMATGRKSADVYYGFTAGPGEVRLTVDGTTDGYSTTFTVELLPADGATSLGSIPAMAAESQRRAAKTFVLTGREPLVLKVSTHEDAAVKWLKYRIRISGAAELAAPAIKPAAAVPPSDVAATADAVSDAAPAGDAPVATAEVPAPAADQVSATKAAAASMISRLTGISGALPVTGVLQIEMKDGSIQQIDLAAVRKMFIHKK